MGDLFRVACSSFAFICTEHKELCVHLALRCRAELPNRPRQLSSTPASRPISALGGNGRPTVVVVVVSGGISPKITQRVCYHAVFMFQHHGFSGCGNQRPRKEFEGCPVTDWGPGCNTSSCSSWSSGGGFFPRFGARDVLLHSDAHMKTGPSILNPVEEVLIEAAREIQTRLPGRLQDPFRPW